MIDGLSLDSLRAFRTFAQLLNFTHAAERLHLSQPALHVKIRELSRHLGVALYTRQGRRLELTEKGRQLSVFAGEMEDRLASFAAEFREESQAPIVLAAGQGAYLNLLGPALQRFLELPGQQLQLKTLDRDACVEATLSGQAHLGVAVLETVPEALATTVLLRTHSVLVVPKKHRLVRRRGLSLADLEGESLVVPPADRPHRQVLAGALQAAGVLWKVGVEAQGWELMLHFVGLGLGVAIVNSSCAIPPGLVARPLPGLPTRAYSVFHRRGYLRPEAQTLRRLLVENCWRACGEPASAS